MDASIPFQVVGERVERDSAVFTVIVPDDCQYFQGHFPGHAVLPAIGQLAIVAGLLRLVGDRRAVLTGADRLRFCRQVLPGDRIDVCLDLVGGNESAGFEIRSDGALVSRGRVRLAVGSRG